MHPNTKMGDDKKVEVCFEVIYLIYFVVVLENSPVNKLYRFFSEVGTQLKSQQVKFCLAIYQL